MLAVEVVSLSRAQALVEAFHIKFGVPAPLKPQEAADVDWVRHMVRFDWIHAEEVEGFDATDTADVAELADAYVDIIVFALGGLVELGVDGSPLFDAVMKSNMTKVKIPGQAKIAKPPGFKHPDIAGLIELQRKAR